MNKKSTIISELNSNYNHGKYRRADFFKEAFRPPELDIFKSPTGDSFITIEGITCPVLGSEFRDLLERRHYKEFGFFPVKTKVNSVIEEINKFTRLFGDVKPIFYRFAKHDGVVYVDLGTPDFMVIEISSDKVRVITNPPVKFIRSSIQKTIHSPNTEAVATDLRRLRKYIPFKTGQDFILLVAWMLACMDTDGGYPPLFLVGEQGSAKSTTTALIKDLLDPCSVPLRNLSKTMRELMIAASNDFILCYDNISKLTNNQSDNLCKLATGAGFTTRKLYTTMEETQCSYKRPTLINTIGYVPTRQDLLDRSIIVHLDFIKTKDRKTTQELMDSWEQDRPLIFGAICNATSAALRNYDSVKAEGLPRMADFAKWIIAAEDQLPWAEGGFMKAFQSSRSILVDDAIDADPVAMAVLNLMNARQEWEGTASELLNLLSDIAGHLKTGYTGWPKIPNHLSQQLNRASAFLREKGILFKKSHSGTRSISLSKIVPEEEHQAWEGPCAKDYQERMEAVGRFLPARPQSDDSITSSDESGPSTATATEADF